MRQWRIVFVETPVFTRRVNALLSDEEYRSLQSWLSDGPDRGVLIPGGSGLRKVRWARRGTGKSGGVRVIYYWASGDEVIFMLFAYGKSEQNDLTRDQVKSLARMIREDLQ